MKITLKDIYNLCPDDSYYYLVNDNPCEIDSPIPDDCLDDFMNCEVDHIDADTGGGWGYVCVYVKL